MTAEEMQGVGKNSLLDRFHLVFRNYITKTKSKRKQNKQTKNPICLYPEPASLKKVNEEVSLKLVTNCFE